MFMVYVAAFASSVVYTSTDGVAVLVVGNKRLSIGLLSVLVIVYTQFPQTVEVSVDVKAGMVIVV